MSGGRMVGTAARYLRANAVGTVALFMALGGTSYAVVGGGFVGSAGKLSGCVGTRSGALRLVRARVGCRPGETRVAWNAKGKIGPAGSQGDPGPAGRKGDTGAPGPAGRDGVSITSDPLGSGDATCAFGGSKFLSANATTYACNGAPGQGLKTPATLSSSQNASVLTLTNTDQSGADTASSAVTATGGGSAAAITSTGGPGDFNDQGGTGISATGGAGNAGGNGGGPGGWFTGGTGGGVGLVALGTGTGIGVQAFGGSDGADGGSFFGGGNANGVDALGGGTGPGISATGGWAGASGGIFTGTGTAPGLQASSGFAPGNTSPGITANGYDAGAGLVATGGLNNGNGDGVLATGEGTGSGVTAKAAGSGAGVSATGGSSGNGVNATGGAGNGFGVFAQGSGGAAGVNAVGGINSGAGVAASATGGNGVGVKGSGHGTGEGLYGTSSGGDGVVGSGGNYGGEFTVNDTNALGAVNATFGSLSSAQLATGTQAAQFWGYVTVGGAPNGNPTFVDINDANGNAVLNVAGTINAITKHFKIDDPLDPAHKFLLHASDESPQAMNIYSGNVTTDNRGYATVALPRYFDAENKDPRYQLTVIGTFAQAVVWREESHNQFEIRTDKSRVKVSWQVTAVRNDPAVRADQAKPAEQPKTGKDYGRYLDPAAYGKPVSLAIDPPQPTLSGGTGR